MNRTLMDQLCRWKDKPDRQPLVLKGVRQCGKTWLLQEFGSRYYDDVAYFNFEETPAFASMFEQDYDVQRILLELGITWGKTIQPGTTLIILDEIQACPKALTSLKYFCEKARDYHIVCAGSLLGIAIHENQSFPVGKVDFLTLYPLSFEEFLDAMEQPLLMKALHTVTAEEGISQPVANKLINYLKQYFIIGGMPAVVNSWRQDQNIEHAEDIQQRIISSYELDFVKHAPVEDFPKLSAIWASVPQQLSKTNTKFIFSQVRKGWRGKDLEDALNWLIQAGLIYKVRLVEKPYFPLSSYTDDTSFKIYLSDIGILRRLARVPAGIILDSSDIYREFKGAMTENYVLNELVKRVDDSPYYWSSGNMAEVDFIVQSDLQIVPIEVKSERNVKSRSLAEYRKKYSPEYSVKTSMIPELSGESLLNIPLFMIGEMGRLVR